MRMKLLFVADGRSPISLNWISYFIQAGHEVHLVSTFRCQPVGGVASLTFIPVAMSEYKAGLDGKAQGVNGLSRLLRWVVPVRLRTTLRQVIAPFSLPRAARRLAQVIESVRPGLVHAMRIPYEGMLSAMSVREIGKRQGSMRSFPLLVSVWGNDFTLHARSTKAMLTHTRMTLQQADALHTDCRRDLRMAEELGFDRSKPTIVLPGGGGVQMDIFHPGRDDPQGEAQVSGNRQAFTIINPRGVRSYIRNDTFFKAAGLVVRQIPQASFTCPGMQGDAQAEKWAAETRCADAISLLPHQSRGEMAELFRKAQVSVSITTHDGTPNTLLEAMASGCFPIAGDLESVREWISPGVNGLLVDPADPQQLAQAIVEVANQPELRRRAREMNVEMIKERAEYTMVMHRAEEFYHKLVAGERR